MGCKEVNRRHRRHWSQQPALALGLTRTSLASLLLFVLIVSIGLSGVQSKTKSVRKEKTKTTEINVFNGTSSGATTSSPPPQSSSSPAPSVAPSVVPSVAPSVAPSVLPSPPSPPPPPTTTAGPSPVLAVPSESPAATTVRPPAKTKPAGEKAKTESPAANKGKQVGDNNSNKRPALVDDDGEQHDVFKCGQSIAQEDEKWLPFYAGVLLELGHLNSSAELPVVKLCSGVLINWRTVLVAESCVNSFNLDQLKVTVVTNIKMSANDTERNELHVPATICRNPYFSLRRNTLDDKVEYESDYLLVKMDWPIDNRGNCGMPACLAENTPETCRVANHLCRVMRLDQDSGAASGKGQPLIDLEFYKSSFKEKACRCRPGEEKRSFCLPRSAVRSIRPKKKLWVRGRGSNDFVVKSYQFEDQLGDLDSPFDQKGVIICPCLADSSRQVYWQAVATLSHSCSDHWFAVTPLSLWQEEIFKLMGQCA